MNARILALLLFTGWSVLCWRYYVCNIKQVCGPSSAASSDSANTGAAYVPEDTLNITMDMSSGGSANLNNDAAINPSENDPDINVVNIYELGDLTRIHFPYGSTSKEDDHAVDVYLGKLAAYLKQTGKSALIAGHTDMVGDKKYNLNLALQRANSIRKILTTKGVPKSQLKCSTYGESKPRATNDTPKGRYQNRRVEITLN